MVDAETGERVWDPRCKGDPNCKERPMYITMFDYQLAHGGRMTTRFQFRCEAHGIAFATKHGCELP